jgi:Sec-independent protein translocase protein TatA
MEIFNIGPLELILFLMLMFIILGPQDMVNWSRKAGAWLRKLIRSQIWAEIRDYSQEIRELPTKLVRETGLEEDLQEIRETTNLASDLASVDAVNVVAEANQDQVLPTSTDGSTSTADSGTIPTYPTTIPEPVIPDPSSATIKLSRFSPDTFDIDAAPVVPFYLRDYVKREEERIQQEKEAAEKAAQEAAEREAAQLAEQQAAELAKKTRRKRTPKVDAETSTTQESGEEVKPRRRSPRKKLQEPAPIGNETSETAAINIDTLPTTEQPAPLSQQDLEMKPTRRSPRKKTVKPVETTEASAESSSPAEAISEPAGLPGDEAPEIPLAKPRRKISRKQAIPAKPIAEGSDSISSQELTSSVELPQKRKPRRKKIEIESLNLSQDHKLSSEAEPGTISEQTTVDR